MVAPAVHVTSFKYSSQQHYLMCWGLTIALVVQYIAKPFKSRVVNRLELISIMFTVCFLQLALIFRVERFRGSWAHAVVNHCLNFGLWAIVAIFAYYALPSKAQRALRRRARKLIGREQLHELREFAELSNLSTAPDSIRLAWSNVGSDKAGGGLCTVRRV